MSGSLTHWHRTRRCTLSYVQSGRTGTGTQRDMFSAGDSETPTDSCDTLFDHCRPPPLGPGMSFERP